MSDDERRQLPVEINWLPDGSAGRLYIRGEYWGAIEWSEPRQAWCIEDAQGKCLAHAASIRGQAASKETAIALAREMIHDGRMPDPQQAFVEHRQRQREQREKRAQQPAQIAKRQARGLARKRESELMDAAYKAEFADERAPPIVEELGEAFDFTDPDLWKSNSWAMIRPRLALHQRAVVARLEYKLCSEIERTGTQPFAMYASKEERRTAMERRRSAGEREISRLQARLDKAREVLSALEGPNERSNLDRNCRDHRESYRCRRQHDDPG
jgi:hypothetical protein